MKLLLTVALFVSLAAGAAAAQGAGFSGIGGETSVARTPSTAQTQRVAVRSNVPTYATTTRNAKRGRKASERQMADAAMAYRSSGWNAKWAVPVKVGEARAFLRVVVADGQPFAVLGKIRQPFLRGKQPRSLARAFQPVMEQATGCKATGGLFSYGPNPTVAERIAYRLSC